GVVDWEALSQTKRSVGYANFEYLLRRGPLDGSGTDDKLRIAAENGRVLQRQVTDRCGKANRRVPSSCPEPWDIQWLMFDRVSGTHAIGLIAGASMICWPRRSCTTSWPLAAMMYPAARLHWHPRPS